MEPHEMSAKENFRAIVVLTPNPQVLVAAIKLPTGAIEVITNSQNLKSKIDYYLNAYDDDFKLKTNPAIEIVGIMLV